MAAPLARDETNLRKSDSPQTSNVLHVLCACVCVSAKAKRASSLVDIHALCRQRERANRAMLGHTRWKRVTGEFGRIACDRWRREKKRRGETRRKRDATRRDQRKRPRLEAACAQGSMVRSATDPLAALAQALPIQTARQNEQNWHESGHEKERRASALGEERWPISRYSAHMP